MKIQDNRHSLAPYSRDVAAGIFISALSLLLGIWSLGALHFDLSIPLVYNTGDATWQLSLTKMLRDTGWILTNPYLGAPDVAHWHQNSAAQTSALHSILMLGLSYFINDAVKIQQIYYILNFPLIALTSFLSCRILKISTFPAMAVGIIFAFTTFRFNYIIYSFLPNYAALPLAIVPVVWVGLGEFSLDHVGEHPASKAEEKPASKFPLGKFLGSLACIILITISDGYYAFFTLLLLGFATFLRLCSGDIFKPRALLAPLLLIVTLIGVSFALGLPLQNYKQSHLHEFYPNGVLDPALVKHPFEAEVYSSSLKLMIAPIPNHHILPLAELGDKIVQTSEAARSFKLGAHSVPLGTLGSLLLLGTLCYLMIPAFRLKTDASSWKQVVGADRLANLLASLVLFSFLCSITGGIGSLIALIFPTIRAYDRLPIIILFLLLLLAARLASMSLKRSGPITRQIGVVLIVLVAIAALYDQIPRTSLSDGEGGRNLYIAERNFVQKIEASVPQGSMIYQYPYSDYLIMSKYYGWGSFAPVRLYLHSKNIHWSSGPAKNSYVENWNLRLAKLPFDQMLNEVAAVGFAGMVIDRTVVPDSEYVHLVRALSSHGAQIVDDQSSHLAFAKFNNSGFRLEFDSTYTEAVRLVITDPAHVDVSALPSLVDRKEFKKLLAELPANSQPLFIEKSVHPEVFLNGTAHLRSSGEISISPLTDMKGTLRCALSPEASSSGQRDVLLDLTNASNFDWNIGAGSYPIGIGLHLYATDGTPLRGDDGTRISTAGNSGGFVPNSAEASLIKPGSTAQFRVPLSKLNLNSLETAQHGIRANFQVVQDGNAWFANLGCSILINN
ncbi:hypothetical protein [Rhizobium leucaenae]|uniref:Uncharacterized protein n=1 Tax=Rhizobium leucaenae TaxID=29450 RepID=A0A7W6ZZP2_9HYPH|nr:hypothetical protein [Rhizobium leucaenae]MBB4571689.1 hypothetical protein [Rhizobium leucaenae]